PLVCHAWSSIPRHIRIFSSHTPCPPLPSLFPYTTLFRSVSKHQPTGPSLPGQRPGVGGAIAALLVGGRVCPLPVAGGGGLDGGRSEEHTSELQSRENLVCRLLLERKNDKRAARLSPGDLR